MANDLRFWAEHGSWAYCTRCGSLQSKKLLPGYRKRAKPTSSTSRTCNGGRYKVPHPTKVPAVLQNLTMDDIYALRPFRAFSGRYNRMMFGYRVREEPFKIKWAQEDVEVKIRNIRDPVSRRRRRAAFEYLMKKRNCLYKKFIMMHRSHVCEPWIFELFRMNRSMGLRLHYGSTYTTTIACVSLSSKGKKLARAARYLS